MRLVHLTAGTGSFFCGTCLRDHALVKALRRLGHDALMVPLYLPLVLDDSGSRGESPLFFGGINVYLQQKSAFFRRTPQWFDKLLDSPALLRQAGRRAGMTNPRELGEMTLSMIKGELGHQAKELDKLVAWLIEQKPDVVCLSNSLLIGVARRVREELRVPIVCSLQGEDAFLDSLPEPYRERCWQLVRERAADVDRFVAPSRYYNALMQERLRLAPEKIVVIYNGIDLDGFAPATTPPEFPTVGFLARMCRTMLMPDDFSTPIEGYYPWDAPRRRHCACLRSKEMSTTTAFRWKTAVPVVFSGAARRTNRSAPTELLSAWKIAAPAAPATSSRLHWPRRKKPL